MINDDIEYPYYKLIYIPYKLKKYNFIKYNNERYIIIKDKWKTNFEINNLTDYFSENIRITCKFGNNISPLEYWNKYKKIILNKTNNISQMREIIYSNINLCNNFRISLSLTILNIFKPKKWLDILAGW
jgi:hypothetical protein